MCWTLDCRRISEKLCYIGAALRCRSAAPLHGRKKSSTRRAFRFDIEPLLETGSVKDVTTLSEAVHRTSASKL